MKNKFIAGIIVFFAVMALSFSVSAATDSTEVITSGGSGGNEKIMSGYQSTKRWASVVESYIIKNADNTFSVVDASGTCVNIDTYDADTYELTDTVKLDFELELFGGFYSGKKYNYIVFGQENPDEDDTLEVIRLVKYDKAFNRIEACAVTDCYTTIPFDAGSLRMDEYENELVIHTSRERYMTEDGLNHQSQLTVIIDTDKMTVTNYLGRFQDNHVSHSFNQFVKYDGSNHVLVDHGDAYPRTVALNKHGSYGYSETTLFNIPGKIGANCTGVTVGGFEISDDSYLVAINTIDHNKATSYDSYKIYGLETDERDTVLLVSGKDNSSADNVKKIYLTDYVDNKKLASTPYLVKISNDKFVVLWEEFVYQTEIWYGQEYITTVSQGVKYVFADGQGNLLSDTKNFPDAHLSSDCQPIVLNDAVIWYKNENDGGRTFYTVKTENIAVHNIGNLSVEFESELGIILNITSSADAISIPATIGGVKVSAIADNAFSGCAYVKEITIPNTVKSISQNAFDGLGDIKLKVKANSKALAYAVENRIPYEIITYTQGDIDGNEEIDINDAIALFRYSMLPDVYSIDYQGDVDFDKNGTVDIDDAILLFRHSILPDLYPLM